MIEKSEKKSSKCLRMIFFSMPAVSSFFELRVQIQKRPKLPHTVEVRSRYQSVCMWPIKSALSRVNNGVHTQKSDHLLLELSKVLFFNKFLFRFLLNFLSDWAGGLKDEDEVKFLRCTYNIYPIIKINITLWPFLVSLVMSTYNVYTRILLNCNVRLIMLIKISNRVSKRTM